MTEASDFHAAYLAAAAEPQRSLLEAFRSAALEACPEAVPTVRWKQPMLDHHGPLLMLSARKAHVNLTFWLGRQMKDPEGVLTDVGSRSGLRTLRVEASGEPPPRELLRAYVAEAAALNEARAAAKRAGRPSPRARPARSRPEPRVPEDLAAALERSPSAAAVFAGFSPTNRREYVEWLTEAKREATRARRLAQAIEWIAEGKPRNWKYM